jgi:hypothetical protein
MIALCKHFLLRLSLSNLKDSNALGQAVTVVADIAWKVWPAATAPIESLNQP